MSANVVHLVEYLAGLSWPTPMSISHLYCPFGCRCHTVMKSPKAVGTSSFPFGRNSQLPVVYPISPLEEIAAKLGAHESKLGVSPRAIQKGLASVRSGVKTTASS